MTRPTRVRVACLLILALLAAACDTGGGKERTSPAKPGRQVILGMAAQTRHEVEQREDETGQRLPGMRVFRRWDQPLIDPDLRWARDTGHTVFLSIKSRRLNGLLVPWHEIADAVPGSPLHNDLLRQAVELQAFQAPVYFVFNHEPEARPSLGMGTPQDYVAAWIRLVETYRAAGATNVRYVWTMTNLGFERGGDQFYPGDRYVDAIAVDAYNFYTCLSPATKWASMADLLDAHRRFGARHPGKQLMVLEWGSAEDPARPGRKAAWLRAAADLFRRPEYAAYTAVLHWDDRHNDGAAAVRCDLDYRSSATALAAWRELAAGAPYRAG